jgi:hypothetical protein
MRGAFSKTSSAAAFGSLLLFLLAAPWLTGKMLQPGREQAFASAGMDWGPYPWIWQEVFLKNEPLDIVFMGSSHILVGVDAPYVQARLEQAKGSPARVRTLGWSGNGYDTAYFVAKELFARRKVDCLVLYDDIGTFNPKAPSWFRFADNWEDISGLQPFEQATYYFAAVVGWLRGAVQCIVPTLPPDATSLDERTAQIFDGLGSWSRRVGYGKSKFIEFSPQNDVTASDAIVFSKAPEDSIHFLGWNASAREKYFARKIADLAEKHDCRLVILHLPKLGDRNDEILNVRYHWPTVFDSEVEVFGVPPKRFFSGMSEEEARKLYYDGVHLNENGQKYFTPIITPALIDIYLSKKNG